MFLWGGCLGVLIYCSFMTYVDVGVQADLAHWIMREVTLRMVWEEVWSSQLTIMLGELRTMRSTL